MVYFAYQSLPDITQFQTEKYPCSYESCLPTAAAGEGSFSSWLALIQQMLFVPACLNGSHSFIETT